MNNEKISRIGKEFDRELKEIIRIRRLDIDKNLPREIGMSRITNGIIKFPEWDILKKKLMKEPKKEDLK